MPLAKLALCAFWARRRTAKQTCGLVTGGDMSFSYQRNACFISPCVSQLRLRTLIAPDLFFKQLVIGGQLYFGNFRSEYCD
jgi:hypothetical protein